MSQRAAALRPDAVRGQTGVLKLPFLLFPLATKVVHGFLRFLSQEARRTLKGTRVRLCWLLF